MIRLLVAVGVSASPAPIFQLRDDTPVDRTLGHEFSQVDDPIIKHSTAERLTKENFDSENGKFIVIRYAYWCTFSQEFLQKWDQNKAAIQKHYGNTHIYWLETETEKNNKMAPGVWRKIARNQNGMWGLPNIQMVTKSGRQVTSYRLGKTKFIKGLRGLSKNKQGRSKKNKACSKRKQRKQLRKIQANNPDDPIIQTPGAKHISYKSLKKVKGSFIAVRYMKNCRGFEKLKQSWNAFMKEIRDQGHNWPVYFVQTEEDKSLRAGGRWEFQNTIDDSTSVPNVQFVHKKKCKGTAHTQKISPYPGEDLTKIVKAMELFQLHWAQANDDSCDTSGGFPSNYGAYHSNAAKRNLPHFHYVKCKNVPGYGVLYCNGGQWTEVPKDEWKC